MVTDVYAKKVEVDEPPKLCPFLSGYSSPSTFSSYGGFLQKRCVRDNCEMWNSDVKGCGLLRPHLKIELMYPKMDMVSLERQVEPILDILKKGGYIPDESKD